MNRHIKYLKTISIMLLFYDSLVENVKMLKMFLIDILLPYSNTMQ